MFSITTNLFLVAILLLANTQMLMGQSDAAGGDGRIKAQVTKLGPGAKVTVTLKDGKQLRGSISQILDDSFDVTLEKQTQSNIISYRDVENVKRRGWSNTAKLALGIGAGVGLTLVALAILVNSSVN